VTYFLNAPQDPSPGPPSGRTGGISSSADSFWSQWDLGYLQQGFLNFEDRRVEDAIMTELGREAESRLPPRGIGGGLPGTDMYYAGIVYEARRAAALDPDSWADLDVSETFVFTETQARLNAQRDTLLADIAAAPESSVVAELGASFGAAIFNWKTLPFLMLGGPGGSFLKVAAREASINVAIETSLMPAQFRAHRMFGMEDPNVARELVIAAAFGAAFGVGFEALGRGLSYAAGMRAPRPPGHTRQTAEMETERAAGILNTSDDPVTDLRNAAPIDFEPDLPPLINEPPPPRDPSDFDVPDPGPRPDGGPTSGLSSAREEVQADLRADMQRAADEERASLERDYGPWMTGRMPFARMIRNMGGIQSSRMVQGNRVQSYLAGELAARDITPRTLPWLFNNRTGVENFDELTFESSMLDIIGRRQEVDGEILQGSGFGNPDNILDLITREFAGERIPNSLDMQQRLNALERFESEIGAQMDFLGGAYAGDNGFFVDPVVYAGDEGSMRLGREFDEWLVARDYELTPGERSETLGELSQRGGDADFLVERVFQRRLEHEERFYGPDADQAIDGSAPAGRDADLEGTAGQEADGSPAAGTEPRGDAATEQTSAGEQFLTPGTAPITQRERIEARQNEALRADERASDTEIGGLFDPGSRVRADLFDNMTTPAAERMRDQMTSDMREAIARDGDFPVMAEDGTMRPASEVLNDMDQADINLAQIKLCGMQP